MTYADQTRTLGPGELIALISGVRHAVQTLADGAFLLTIGSASGTSE